MITDAARRLSFLRPAAGPERRPIGWTRVEVFFPALTLAVLLGGYGLRTVLRRAASGDGSEPGLTVADPVEAANAALPTVDVVVAARDEEAVVTRLVERLSALRYPADRLSLCVVDDGSEDRTPDRLAALQDRFPALRVIRRPRNAGGGKSGALNAALAQTRGVVADP